jgi:hypothetical protein
MHAGVRNVKIHPIVMDHFLFPRRKNYSKSPTVYKTRVVEGQKIALSLTKKR